MALPLFVSKKVIWIIILAIKVSILATMHPICGYYDIYKIERISAKHYIYTFNKCNVLSIKKGIY